eukprot:TRINITY_DN16120_c3_g1_i1.p1 TRINITY_DN16120_c3_g1~~TRINITY_DN16120_c3_g1_i1.p1  ORF type:complete len:130 (+),score=14.06 TRINITY_DN16120_c3_g1_i1:97-486(+)
MVDYLIGISSVFFYFGKQNPELPTIYATNVELIMMHYMDFFFSTHLPCSHFKALNHHLSVLDAPNVYLCSSHSVVGEPLVFDFVACNSSKGGWFKVQVYPSKGYVSRQIEDYHHESLAILLLAQTDSNL